MLWISYWKKQWVAYLLYQYDMGPDLSATINILKAVKWGLQAWEYDIKVQTILKCFHKALHSIDKDISNPNIIREINSGLQQL
jgi:hypothetical protein